MFSSFGSTSEWWQNAQKQAIEAAEKAKALAQQAQTQLAEQAMVLAEQAKVHAEQAKVQAQAIAEKASEQAQVLAKAATEQAQKQLKEVQQYVADVQLTASGMSSSSSSKAEEGLLTHGISKEFMEYVGSLTYSNFSDYPVDVLPSTNPLGVNTSDPGDNFELSQWQKTHCTLILQNVNQLQLLRYALCPRRMSEGQFWLIYFTLTKDLLPAVAFETPPPVQPTTAATATELKSDSLKVSTSNKQRVTEASNSSTPQEYSPSTNATAAMAAAGIISLPTMTDNSSPKDSVTVVSSTQLDGPDGDGDGDGGMDGAAVEELLAEVDVDGDDEVDDDDLDKLAELDNDPELAAYLQAALNADDVGDDGSGDGSGSVGEDLDDYINQLDEELNGEEGDEETAEGTADA